MKILPPLFLIFFITFSAQAEQTIVQELIIENAWIREAPPTVKVLAAYMTLKNLTNKDITLICAESPVFKDVMFHKTEISKGIAKMRHANEITIPAHSDFTLSPGNYHMMLMGRTELLKEGDDVELMLIFRNIDNQKITVTVKKSITE